MQKNDNQPIVNSSNNISTNNSNAAINKYNEVQLMKKINKEFDERCLKIRNRIQRIKKEEENYQKQMINYKRREIHDKLIKDDKKKLKLEIEKNKEERNKALNNKKQFIQSQRQKDNIYRDKKKNANLSQKKLNYQTSLNDKYLMKIIKEQLKTQQLNKNTYSHAKVRQELNEFETNKMKRNLEKENQIQQIHENNITQLKLLEKEMKSTCDQLEELEKQAIESLNKTKYMNLKIVGDNSYKFNNFANKKKNKNFNKQVNKSMGNININGIDDKIEKNNLNKSTYSKKNRIMSPTNKSKMNNLDINNKSKTKYGNSITINKSNKSKINKSSSIGKNKSTQKTNEKNKDKNKEQKKLNKNEDSKNNINK